LTTITTSGAGKFWVAGKITLFRLNALSSFAACLGGKLLTPHKMDRP
jgi:hypothetical protein